MESSDERGTQFQIPMRSTRLTALFGYFLVIVSVETSVGFSMSSRSREIYGVPNSGWTSPEWNWGYAQGTGHDCAAICRELYMTRAARQRLVDNLLSASLNEPENPEEIKLILALEWQRGRWDGTDGGRGGYSEVLSTMAAAERYEHVPYEECLQRLVDDMADPKRFGSLGTTSEEVEEMKACVSAESTEKRFRKCAGMILRAMGYVDRGV